MPDLSDLFGTPRGCLLTVCELLTAVLIAAGKAEQEDETGDRREPHEGGLWLKPHRAPGVALGRTGSRT